MDDPPIGTFAAPRDVCAHDFKRYGRLRSYWHAPRERDWCERCGDYTQRAGTFLGRLDGAVIFEGLVCTGVNGRSGCGGSQW